MLLSSAPLYAAGLTDPVVAPEVVVADTVESSQDDTQIIIPLMVMLLIMGAGFGG